jgi:ABC-type transporter Mla MlaB component
MTLSNLENAQGNILKIGTVLSISKVAELLKEIILNFEKNQKLIFALDEVEECDAAGIQLLCSVRKTADVAGKTLEFYNPSAAVLNAMKDVGSNVEEFLITEN